MGYGFRTKDLRKSIFFQTAKSVDNAGIGDLCITTTIAEPFEVSIYLQEEQAQDLRLSLAF